jgi:hypothetical protein
MLFVKHIHMYDDPAEPAVDPFPETQYWENGEEGGDDDDGISPLPPDR